MLQPDRDPLIAGSEVSINCRFWVSTEASSRTSATSTRASAALRSPSGLPPASKRSVRYAVLKVHGVKPEWKSYKWTALTPSCQQHFRRINLRWHDLRHEYSTLLDESDSIFGPVGRDSNPDNVVQRAVPAFRSASIRSALLCLYRRPLQCAYCLPGLQPRTSEQAPVPTSHDGIHVRSALFAAHSSRCIFLSSATKRGSARIGSKNQ